MKNHMYTYKRNQSGAAIIVCLMLLTISTLIAISSVSSTVMEEKMAGNIRNKHVSFQATEAGLRGGEVAADALGTAAVFDGTAGLYPVSKPGDANYPVWEQAATNWISDTTITIGSITTTPEYLIEDYSNAPRDADCKINKSDFHICSQAAVVYRITAKAPGTNSGTVSMIQSTFKQL